MCGWVLTCRDMGGVIFVDVRDREGVVQTAVSYTHLDVYKRQQQMLTCQCGIGTNQRKGYSFFRLLDSKG